MRVRRTVCAAIPLILVASLVSAQARTDTAIPHLRRQGSATQLIVGGAPFLVLGGELGNSSASSMSYMAPRWQVLKQLNLNTVLAPAYWEMIEPREGVFDFTSVDSLIDAARREGLRVGLLWFGSWKNSMSSYAPAWVKTNQARFPRTESTRGQGQEILAPFDSANWSADARAFRALMRHLRQADGTHHTVILVQVENEIGMLPTARDHSRRADSLYAAPVPVELMRYLNANRDSLAPQLASKWAANGRRTLGSWTQVFGDDVYTEELFMAWWFARFTERVAAAGKAEYPLPMNVNAALIRPGHLPGRYVSAGPLPHLIDAWRAAAPSIDMLSPDIYFLNFTEWVDRYAVRGNPLFIPEATIGARSATNALYAIGRHDAIGFSPFSIESAAKPEENPIGASYAMLAQIAPLILAHQGRGSMTGVTPPVAFDGTVDARPQAVTLRGLNYGLTVSFSLPPSAPVQAGANAPVVFGDAGRDYAGPISGAIIIALDSNEVLVGGTGVSIRFSTPDAAAPITGILSAHEGRYMNGRWVPGRWLNGDQTDQGRSVRIGDEFELLRVRLYRYR